MSSEPDVPPVLSPDGKQVLVEGRWIEWEVWEAGEMRALAAPPSASGQASTDPPADAVGGGANFCSGCGTPSQDQGLFCSRCGASLPPTHPPSYLQADSQWTEQSRPIGAPPMPPPPPIAPGQFLHTQATVKQKNWFLRHKILTGIGAFILLGIIGSALGSGSSDKTNNAADKTPVATQSESPAAATHAPTAADRKAAHDKVVAEHKAAHDAAVAQALADQQAARDAAAAEAAANAWKAGGYTETSQDETVAYKWNNSGCDSSYSACWGMQIVVKDGCDNLYIEVSISNAAGEKIGYSNDVLTGLAPGDHGRMNFTDTTGSGDTARISKVNCY